MTNFCMYHPARLALKAGNQDRKSSELYPIKVFRFRHDFELRCRNSFEVFDFLVRNYDPVRPGHDRFNNLRR